MKRISGILLCLYLLSAGHTTADEGKFSGLLFGDYYWVAANHDASLEDRNGFWLRRIYLTYDQGLNEEFAFRLRLEMSNQGDFNTSSKIEPFVKDAYLEWKNSGHKVLLGLSSTPTFGLIEKSWGYRAVEKTPLDLQKFGSTRDMGVAVKGNLDADDRVYYHLMFANGSGTEAEVDTNKKIYLALGFKPTDSFTLEAYGDREGQGELWQYTVQGVASYQCEGFRAGGLFARQTLVIPDLDDGSREIISFFGVARFAEKVNVLGRFDHMYDRATSGISYLPFDHNAGSSNLFIAGVDFSPAKDVHVIPNVEIITYGETEHSEAPDTDVMPRLTLFFKFK